MMTLPSVASAAPAGASLDPGGLAQGASWLETSGLGTSGLGASGLGASAAEHLWQATVFALLVLLLGWSLRGAPARLRYNLYLLAPMKFLVPSAALLLVAHRFGGDLRAWIPPGLTALFDAQGALTAARRLLGFGLSGIEWGASAAAPGTSSLWLWAMIAWGLGAAILGLVWCRRLAAFRRLLREGGVPASGHYAERLRVQRLRLGLKAEVGLTISPDVAEPGVWGVVDPTVVLPASMAGRLDPDELDAVLLHELVHVERRDNLVAHALMVLRCLFWFHPLLWWLDRRLLSERERACDERVVEVTGQPEAYLRGLAKVLHLGLGARPLGVSMASGSDLKRRIRRLRGQAVPTASHLHRGVWIVALGLLATSSLSAARLCTGGKTRLQARTALELLQESGAGEEGLLRRLPDRAPWPSRAACPKKPLRTAARPSPDCDDLRRM